jgi:dTDP-4-dehydrorhamnose 3,5-epimerase
MKFVKTNLKDAWLIQTDRRTDERGYFMRAWCQKEFRENGIGVTFVQANTAFSALQGTLRGFHYQVAPYEEAKLVRCTAGEIYDVIIDLRPDSPTYKKWQSFHLSDKNGTSVFIPEGFAHSYMTLRDNTEVYYMVSQYYAPEAERGVRWNDPSFKIDWPLDPPNVISDKDRNFGNYIQ